MQIASIPFYFIFYQRFFTVNDSRWQARFTFLLVHVLYVETFLYLNRICYVFVEQPVEHILIAPSHHMEKARAFDPFGHAGLTPLGEIRMTLAGEISCLIYYDNKE